MSLEQEMPPRRIFRRPETREAQEAFVRDNLGLVHLMLNKFRRRLPKRFVGFDEEDLVQAGTMGLLDAARLFDPDRGFQFSTYASRAIWNRFRRVVNGDDDSKARDWGVRQVRLGARVRNHDTATLGETLVDHRGDGDRRLLARDEVEAAGWHVLFDRQREVLRMRYLDGLTMEEVGRRLSVSRARVEQIEREAIRRMAAWRVRRDGETPADSEDAGSDADGPVALHRVTAVLVGRGWTTEAEIGGQLALNARELSDGLQAAAAAGLVESLPLASGELIWRAISEAPTADGHSVAPSCVRSESASCHEAA